MKSSSNRLPLAFCFAVLSLVACNSQAVLFHDTGDPTHNTTAPTGALTNSGWQYEGHWQNVFLGTPIAPHYFLAAQHIGGSVGNVFSWNGANYTTTWFTNSPDSDLRIWQVAQTFPSYAPLYTNMNAAGQLMVVIGRGTQRGWPVLVNGATNGWLWGASDNVQRWGENVVTASYSPYLYATFDAVGTNNECDVSVGDSSGGVFIQQGGVWALAGIIYAVNGPFSTNCVNTFQAALLDERGTCYYPTNYAVAVPSGFYASSVPNDLNWITSVIGGINVTPIAATGYNENIVIGSGTAVTASIFSGTSLGRNWYWYASGTPGTPAGGIPMGGTITSLYNPTTTFTFQSAAAANNVAYIGIGQAGIPVSLTLILNTPAAYSELSLLGIAMVNGNYASPTYTINYANPANNQSGTLTLYNFNGTGTTAWNPSSSTTDGADLSSFGSSPLCEMDIPVRDQTDPITGITLVASLASGSHEEFFFALSGAAVATSAPSTLAFTSIARSGNDVQLVWKAAGGTTNVVEASPNLSRSGFVNISGNLIIPGSGTVTNSYTDPGGATKGLSRFYRVRRAP